MNQTACNFEFLIKHGVIKLAFCIWVAKRKKQGGEENLLYIFFCFLEGNADCQIRFKQGLLAVIVLEKMLKGVVFM